MAEETTNPVQTAPEQAAPPDQTPPVQAVPPAPAAPEKRRESNALLIFLTVLLILVGIADLVLWSVAGYQLLRKAQFGGVSEPVQTVSAGTLAQSASGGEKNRETLGAYIQEMPEAEKL